MKTLRNKDGTMAVVLLKSILETEEAAIQTKQAAGIATIWLSRANADYGGEGSTETPQPTLTRNHPMWGWHRVLFHLTKLILFWLRFSFQFCVGKQSKDDYQRNRYIDVDYPAGQCRLSHYVYSYSYGNFDSGVSGESGVSKRFCGPLFFSKSLISQAFF